MKYLILGAGPAGLSFALGLKGLGEEDFLILEKETQAGGLCRSAKVDGSPLDIGGGHFLDVKRPEVCQFLFQFLPKDEWNLFNRDSRISLKGTLVSHPIEANIWQMPIDSQVAYLQSIAAAGCNIGHPKPGRFTQWIYWKLGKRIAEDYMLPYNRKMFADDLDALGTYWLEKLPDVSFEETLRSCLAKKAYGRQPGHAQFYYPKQHGYGELWLRMAKRIEGKVLYHKKVSAIDFQAREVVAADGSRFRAEHIVTTVPWASFQAVGMPDDLKASIGKLKHTALQVAYFNGQIPTNAHWIYEPDEGVSYHRILVRHNFSQGSGYWTETNQKRVPDIEPSKYTYINEYAYPLNTIGKPDIIKQLLTYSQGQGIYGLGRWGRHQHYNSDVVVEAALKLARHLAGQGR